MEHRRNPEVYVLTYRQEELSWRRIVFLPFNFAWRFLMALLGCLYFTMLIYIEVFSGKSCLGMGMALCTNTLTFITFFHLVDLFFSILHRTWGPVQKSMPHQPKSLLVLSVDMLSLIPFRVFLNGSFLREDNSIGWLQILRLVGCLRVYRIFVELIGLQQKMWLNPIVVCVVQANALVISVVLVLCSVWYTFGILNEGRPLSWLDDLIHARIDVDKDKPDEMYLFSFLHVFSLLSNELVADLRPLNSYEMYFMIAVLYLGATVRLSFALGNLMQSCLKYQGHMYKIKDFIAINQKYLHNKYSKELIDYYNLFWSNWWGLHRCPLLDTFPLCLQKDVLTDVYWDAIDHSHVLRHFPINIKRQVSLMMQSKFMQPGDYIFRKGEVRSTYFYIATGVVQIMSHYDGVSPIMTISSGSCLGSRSLTLPTHCPTDVICATECEVRYLTMKDFYTVLSMHLNGAEIAQKVELEHMSHIKRMFVLSKAYRQDDHLMKLYGVAQDDKLKWIKNRWRTLSNIDLGIAFSTSMAITPDMSLKHLMQNYLPVETTHTSKYLDGLVLSSEAKWAADRCCLRTTCPYIIDPNCNFNKIWMVIIVVLITIDCICVPYYTAFLHDIPHIMVSWDHIICIAYLFDIYLQMVTAAKIMDKTISEPMPLLRYHLKSITFLVDVVATIPIREVFRFFIEEQTISRYLTLPRLMKIVRVVAFFKYKNNYITSSTMVTHVFKYLYLSFFITYFSACFFFMFACWFEGSKLTCQNRSWFSNMLLDLVLSFSPGDYSVTDLILLSLYRVLKFVFRGGINSSPLVKFSEICYSCFLILVCNNVILYANAELMAMWIMRRRRQLACLDLVKSLQVVLTQKSVHDGLINMIVSYINLEWRHNYAVYLNLEENASEILSPKLNNEQHQLIKKWIRKIDLFKELDTVTLRKLVQACKLYRVPKGFIFCRSGEPPTSFNLIIKGVCNLTSMLKEDVIEHPRGKLLRPGQYFPLFEILQNIPCLQTTVSVTACEVIAIDNLMLKTFFFNETDDWSPLVASCVGHTVDQLDAIVSKTKYRRVMEATPNFYPRVNSKAELQHKRRQQRRRKVYNQWIYAVINYIDNPPYIINPNGTFWLVWETIKCVQVLITLIYIPYMFNLICQRFYFKYVLALLLDTFSLADVVMRFYVGNYNAKGVLVNPNGHYLSRSFFVDVLSSLPSYILIRHQQFHVKFFLTVIPKLLQMYRLSGYYYAILARFKLDIKWPMFIMLYMYVSVLLYVFAHIIYVGSCTAYCDEQDVFHVTCVSDSWIADTIYYERGNTNRNPTNLLFFFANFITFVVLGNDQGGFLAKATYEMKMILVFVVITTICRVYYLPKAVSCIVGHYQNFTKHRDNHRLYWAFINNEGGNKAVAQRIYNHFTFDYLKMKGIKMGKFVQTLHPSIQYDLTFAMYYPGMLCLHWFVGPSKTFMKLLCNKVVEHHYKSDATILRINDVNQQICFVREGHINVFNNEYERVRKLGPGSMFGSFKKSVGTRHSYLYVSKYNSQLLTITSDEFMKVLQEYDINIYKQFLIKIKDKENINYKDEATKVLIEPILTNKVVKPGILNQSSATYRWVMFCLSMFVPYFTIFPVMLSVAINNHIDHLELLIPIYLLDFLALLRIFLGFNCTYIDEMTGIHMSNLRQIRWDYLITPSQFFLDLVTLLPLELVGFALMRKWYCILMINRLGRLVIMWRFMKYYRERTYVRIWLRWFEFFSAITLPIHISVCLWIYLTCQNGCAVSFNMKYLVTNDMHEMVMFAMYEVTNIMTFSTSYELEKPWNVVECKVMVFISVTSFVFLPAFVGKFIQISIMSNYNQRRYEYKNYCMKIYLQLRDLSASLLERLWNHSLLLYRTNNGHELPPIINHAPMSMRCELFYDLYGGHIKYNLLFDECVHDLIVQLAGKLRRTVYFPGDFIIRKLDVDNRMYFINSGEVEELEFDEMNTEVIKEVYITGHCFGLAQGLYERTPHMSFYKARTMVEILTLQRSDWAYFADCFPNDVKSIFKMARKLSLDSMGGLPQH